MDLGRLTCALLLTTLATLSAGIAAQPVDNLTIMSFNLWIAASRVNEGLDKALNAIEVAGADVVAIQESMGAAGKIARQLGWHVYAPGYASSLAIISRYPITKTYPFSYNRAGLGARIKLSDVQEIVLWSVHLSPVPYGPYDACLHGRDTQEIIRRQQEAQLKEFADLLDRAGEALRDSANTPVFIVGDFNTPSHLDWTLETANRHCGYAIEFPVSVAAHDAGLRDAYRIYLPDPLLEPGNTWSPIYANYQYPTGKPEPMDRIDFIYFAGASVTVTQAATFVVGEPHPSPSHWNNRWPSDHAAVLVEVALGR